MDPLVDPPFAIQLEPVEGCSLACSFCGISSIRANGADAELGVHGKNSAPYRFMLADTLRCVVDGVKRLGWNPRFEFAMHGEPSMHPDLAALVRIVRSRGPYHVQVTSNGSGLLTPDRVRALMDAGTNLLVIDDYVHASFAGRIRGFVNWLGYPVYEYPADPRGNPHRREKGQRIVFVHDIVSNTTGNHQLTNQGGCSFTPLREPLARRCAKPFRELSVRWDGNVALCCDDWTGAYKIGNVHDGLEAIWHHPRFDAARRRLYQRDRAFGPCRGCNVTTMRDGLLPDKRGKKEMPPPDAESDAHSRAAQRGKVFSIKLEA